MNLGPPLSIALPDGSCALSGEAVRDRAKEPQLAAINEWDRSPGAALVVPRLAVCVGELLVCEEIVHGLGPDQLGRLATFDAAQRERLIKAGMREYAAGQFARLIPALPDHPVYNSDPRHDPPDPAAELRAVSDLRLMRGAEG